jgi:hypothetical protein
MTGDGVRDLGGVARVTAGVAITMTGDGER